MGEVSLKPRSTSVAIIQGDDIERVADLSRRIEHARRAEQSGVSRMGDADLPALEAERERLQDEVSDRAAVIELTALRRTRFRELMAAHPVREGNEDDAVYGVNVDEFAEPFLRESITAVTIGDDDVPAGQHMDLVDRLAEGDWDRVFNAAYYLNRIPGADPREGRSSSAPQTSDAT